MQLILLGSPGAGKGTQAQLLSKKYYLPKISTGDILREAVKNKSSLGLKAEDCMQSGKLVSDDIVLGIVKERLEKDDCKNGYILDGFPRTLIQAKDLNCFLIEKGKKIDFVLNIIVPEENIIKRLSGRRVCSKCGDSYHIIFKKPKNDNYCDKCINELYQRKDDKEETIVERLRQYREQTMPLIDYYKNKGILYNISGDEEIEIINKNIDKLLLGLEV